MNKYTKKYRKIVKGLINKSFPELNGKKIFVFDFPFQVTWASACVTYLGFVVLIFVFPKTKNYSKNWLKGLLAHELSHYEIILNMNFFAKIKFGFKWLFSKKTKAEFETATDKYSIKKGYGRNLYNLVYNNVEKKRTKEKIKLRLSRGYLSSKQIKSYAKKIGKW